MIETKTADLMKIYLVGGAVRDKLLGLPVLERDWVVVGSSPDQMQQLGYQQVGNSFPVFLHPDSKEEYALARTEKKTGPGYKGFDCDYSPTVSLEDDLLRRDLTINAIAEDSEQGLIDPYGGQQDLDKRILRHVSPAFVEDPVRVLRVARFYARFAELDFKIAKETQNMMRDMVTQGELDHLVPERIWAELLKALSTTQPWCFFEALEACGALQKIFPQAEGTLQVCNKALRLASQYTEDTVIRFAAWAGALPIDKLVSLTAIIRAPREYSDLAELAQEHTEFFDNCTQKPPPEVLQGLQTLDAFRRPERFEQYLVTAEAISRAQPSRENWPHPQREYLHTAQVQAAAITTKKLTKTKLKGKELAAELDMHRRAAISKVKRTYRWAKFR